MVFRYLSLFLLYINIEIGKSGCWMLDWPFATCTGNICSPGQGGESRGLNDRVHGISCRYSDKTCKKINYISTNTYSIIMQ